MDLQRHWQINSNLHYSNMKIKFRTAKDDKTYSIEAENFLLIKVTLLEHCGYSTALYIFQKQFESNLLFYHPNEADRNNLVNRNYDSYVEDHKIEIYEAMKTIKEL